MPAAPFFLCRFGCCWSAPSGGTLRGRPGLAGGAAEATPAKLYPTKAEAEAARPADADDARMADADRFKLLFGPSRVCP